MRLEITRRTDLATRAVLALSGRDQRVKAAELAELIGTSSGFLSQVMSPLAAKGWVRSDPGPTGGYQLVADPASISVLDVIEAVEGPTDTEACVLEDRACRRGGPCVLHTPWSAARSHLLTELQATSVAGLRAGGAR